MKPRELRDMTFDELRVRHDELIDELANLRVRLALRQLDNPIQVRYLRRDIARTRTIMQEKQAGGGPGEQPTT